MSCWIHSWEHMESGTFSMGPVTGYHIAKAVATELFPLLLVGMTSFVLLGKYYPEPKDGPVGFLLILSGIISMVAFISLAVYRALEPDRLTRVCAINKICRKCHTVSMGIEKAQSECTKIIQRAEALKAVYYDKKAIATELRKMV